MRLLVVWIAAVMVVGGVGAAIRHSDDSTTSVTPPTTSSEDGQPVVPGSDPTAPSQPGSSDPAATDTTPPPGPAPAPNAVAAPAVGSYPTAVTGTMTVNDSQTFPAGPEGEVVVEPLDSGDQVVSIPLGPGVLSWTLRYRPDAIDLVALDLLVGSTQRFEPPAPPVHVPGSPQAGQSWQWPMESTDGRTRGTCTTTVTGQAAVDVGGQSVPVVVLENVMLFDESSDLQGRIQITNWFSLELRLPVQNHVDLDVNYGGGVISLVSDVTSTLTTLTPS